MQIFHTITLALSLLLTTSLSTMAATADTATTTQEDTTIPAAKTAKNDAESIFKSRDDKINYAIGVQMMGNLLRQGLEVNLDMLTRGMQDAVSGPPYELGEKELRTMIMEYQKGITRRMADARRQASEENKKMGEAFLAANKQKDGVVTTTSGLQYTVLEQGDGPVPTLEDTVTYKFRAILVDGTEVDASRPVDKPATQTVKNLLPGLQEALTMMPVGAKWRVVLPEYLGYGYRGNGQRVAPYSVLIYDLEVLAVDQQQKTE